MEKHGNLVRLGRLVGGWFTAFVSDAERRQPEVIYENAIGSLIEKYGQLRGATAAIVRRREDLGERLCSSERSLAGIEADLDAALEGGEDDLGILLIERKHGIQADLVMMRVELGLAEKEAEEAKTALLSVKNEIEKLKGEKDRMLVQLRSAEARLLIQNQLDGLSVEAEVRALDGVREHIRNTVAEAKLASELRGADLDQRILVLRQRSANGFARAELEARKRERRSLEPALDVLLEVPRSLELPK